MLYTKREKEDLRKSLEQDFLRIEAKLGRQPATHHINFYGKYSIGTYQHEYGSWANFLSSIGREPLLKRRKVLE